jgi:ribose transport system ATP-binding protein
MTVKESASEPEIPAPIRAAAIEGRGVFKAFGGVQALDDASFAASFGEVHALVGENGAGKSTMIKILSGLFPPDAGIIEIRGMEVELRSPVEAQKLSVGTVFQELTLLPWMTVAENLLLRHEPRGIGRLIRRGYLVRRAEAIFADLGIEHVDPRALVADLSLADQQVVEVAHAVDRKPGILFMDEPTSSLAEREVEWLFRLIRKLRREGTCIVFTSHRWREISSIADRITIFRNGKNIATYPGMELGEDQAITLMTGRSVSAMYPEPPSLEGQEPTLEARGLSGQRVQDVSFTLHRGEILGVGGLAGQGHRELFLTLFGVLKPIAGQIVVEGRPRKLRSPHDAIRAGMGIALVPEDRKREGLILPMPIADNLTLPILRRVSRLGVIEHQRERTLVRQTFDRLQIRASGGGQLVRTLSGGNQQKVLIGRWLLADSRILLLYDITRGVDVGTKHDIYELVLDLARQGRSILFYSSDTEEMAHLCHRVLVLREGAVSAELQGPGIDPEKVVAAAVRGSVHA